MVNALRTSQLNSALIINFIGPPNNPPIMAGIRRHTYFMPVVFTDREPLLEAFGSEHRCMSLELEDYLRSLLSGDRNHLCPVAIYSPCGIHYLAGRKHAKGRTPHIIYLRDENLFQTNLHSFEISADKEMPWRRSLPRYSSKTTSEHSESSKNISPDRIANMLTKLRKKGAYPDLAVKEKEKWEMLLTQLKRESYWATVLLQMSADFQW